MNCCSSFDMGVNVATAADGCCRAAARTDMSLAPTITVPSFPSSPGMGVDDLLRGVNSCAAVVSTASGDMGVDVNGVESALLDAMDGWLDGYWSRPASGVFRIDPEPCAVGEIEEL